MLETEVPKLYIAFLSSKFRKWQRWDLNPGFTDSKSSALKFFTALQSNEAKRNNFCSTFFFS